MDKRRFLLTLINFWRDKITKLKYYQHNLTNIPVMVAWIWIRNVCKSLENSFRDLDVWLQLWCHLVTYSTQDSHRHHHQKCNLYVFRDFNVILFIPCLFNEHYSISCSLTQKPWFPTGSQRLSAMRDRHNFKRLLT